jgi:hypothetical protein
MGLLDVRENKCTQNFGGKTSYKLTAWKTENKTAG